MKSQFKLPKPPSNDLQMRSDLLVSLLNKFTVLSNLVDKRVTLEYYHLIGQYFW